MADEQRPDDGLNLDDADRLPWLEPAGEEEELNQVSTRKIVGLVVLGLALLGVIVGGGYWLKNRNGGGGEDAQLIASQGASYKIPANASDAKEFDGEGDESFEASEGAEAAGRIDSSKVPEAPRTDLKTVELPKSAVAEKPAAAKPTVKIAVKTTEAAKKPAAAAATVSAPGAGGPRIQLGAFGSKPQAETVWKKMTGRFDYLAALSHTVEPVETGGKTLYRLRATVASAADATSTCGKLRVGGENWMVVR